MSFLNILLSLLNICKRKLSLSLLKNYTLFELQIVKHTSYFWSPGSDGSVVKDDSHRGDSGSNLSSVGVVGTCHSAGFCLCLPRQKPKTLKQTKRNLKHKPKSVLHCVPRVVLEFANFTGLKQFEKQKSHSWWKVTLVWQLLSFRCC